MEKNVEISILCDFYGELLTEKQQSILKAYYGEDLSLGEIAENSGTSRQAVHDTLKKAESRLRDYESKLRLAERFDRIEESMRGVLGITGKIKASSGSDPELTEKLEEIEEMLKEIEAYI